MELFSTCMDSRLELSDGSCEYVCPLDSRNEFTVFCLEFSIEADSSLSYKSSSSLFQNYSSMKSRMPWASMRIPGSSYSIPTSRLMKEVLLQRDWNSSRYFSITLQSTTPCWIRMHSETSQCRSPSSTISSPSTKMSFLKKSTVSVVREDKQLLFCDLLQASSSGEYRYPGTSAKGELLARHGSISLTVPFCEMTTSRALTQPCPTALDSRYLSAFTTLTSIFSSSSIVNLVSLLLRATNSSQSVCVEQSVSTAILSEPTRQQSTTDSRCSKASYFCCESTGSRSAPPGRWRRASNYWVSCTRRMVGWCSGEETCVQFARNYQKSRLFIYVWVNCQIDYKALAGLFLLNKKKQLNLDEAQGLVPQASEEPISLAS